MRVAIWVIRWILEIIVLVSCGLAIFGIVEWSYNMLIPIGLDIALYVLVKFIDWCKGY